MTTTWTVTHVEPIDDAGMRVVLYTSPGGEQRGHRFPANAPLWRATEYGIDPGADGSAQQLLDVVLHEPFIESADWTGPAHTPGADHAHPHFLYNCDTVADARAHHLGRITAAKARHLVVDPDGLLGELHAVIVADKDRAYRAQAVADMRAFTRQRGAGVL